MTVDLEAIRKRLYNLQAEMAENPFDSFTVEAISSGYMSQLMNGTRCAGPKIRQRLMDVLNLTKVSVLQPAYYPQ